MGVKVEVECEICKKLVPVKAIKITKEGKAYLTLKCGMRPFPEGEYVCAECDSKRDRITDPLASSGDPAVEAERA